MSGGALREIFASVGIEVDGDDLAGFEQGLAGAAERLRAFAGAVASTAVVQGLVELTQRFAENAVAAAQAADRFGLAVPEYQAIGYAAESAGVNAEQLAAVFGTLARQANAAREGNQGAAAAFRALGIRATEADGSTRPLGDLLNDLGDGFDHVQDNARRVALAQQLFGEAGARLLPVLHAGAGGVAALREEFAQLGGGIDADGVAAAQRYRQTMLRMNVALDGLRAQVATALLPVLTRLVDWTGRAVAAWQRFTRGTNVVRIGLIALGIAAVAAAAPVLAAWLPVIAPFLAIAVAVAALVLIIDDLISLFRGGPSAIGDFLDSMFGAGTARAVVAALRDVWRDMRPAIDEAAAAARALASSLGTVANDVLLPALRTVLEFIRGVKTAIEGLLHYIETRFPQVGRALRAQLHGLIPGWALTVLQSLPGIGNVVAGARMFGAARQVVRGASGVLGNVGSTTQAAQAAVGAPGAAVPFSWVRGGTTVQDNRTSATTIQVNGARDPAEVAAEVRRQMDERERQLNDEGFALDGGG